LATSAADTVQCLIKDTVIPAFETPPIESLPNALREAVQRWRERAAGSPSLCAADGRASEALRAQLSRVVACSEFVAAGLLQDPDALAWLESHQHADAASEAAEFERQAAAAENAAQVMSALRFWRRREMMRIAWRDIVGRARVEESLRELTALAEGCIRAAVAAAARLLDPLFGRPRGETGEPVPLIVLGMGKLGGRELNFSSDVDLVFLFAQSGQTDGARSIDNGEYFNRLGRDVIRYLDARTEDGFAFRVDMRLRPFGESGPLAVSLAALEDYLQQHGRDWERYAWIKARAVVGADAYAQPYRDIVRPFVFRRYLDYGVFDSLREMKGLIAREVARRSLEQHLKLGKGGIREIEFIAQSLQLVRGGSDRRLQTPSLLEVMPMLAGAKLLPQGAVRELTAAYLLLRKAENALQMIRDEQTHSLPDDAADRARLSMNMGFEDWPAALHAIDAARSTAARQFDALLFGAPEPARTGGEAPLDWLASDSAIGEELAGGGFPPAEIPAVAAILESYRGAAPYRKLDEAGRRRLHVVLGRLLKAAAGRADPAAVVERVLRVLESIGARSSYLALLTEQPPALDRLIDVCAISGFLARQIAAFPLLLDELVDAAAFDELPSREGFTRELGARTERLPPDDPERQVEAIRQFQKAAVFQVALADLTGRLPLMRVSDRLTDIAELIVQRCLDLAWQQMTLVHGVPMCGEREEQLRTVRVAVAAYGKLGGIELGYGSDLDLVFLHDSSGEIQHTGGDRSCDNGVFFLRLGQRIVHLLTMHSAAGRLYEVDMRLRPNGKGGFLMTGIDAFERYQLQEAWTWEHQALLRARAVAGAAAVGRQFEAARRRVLCGAVRRDTLRTEVAGMRLRMRRELSRAHAGQFDIKQGAGGIADIEFLVQYLVLLLAGTHPELIDHTDNIRQLEGLAKVGALEERTADFLTEAYRGYRAILHRLSLEGSDGPVVEAAPHAETRRRVQEIWRATFGNMDEESHG